MRNQRPSYDEDRNFGHRRRERGGNRDEGFQNRGQGEEWRFQGNDEGRLESEQQWRGGQSGQSGRPGQGGYREYDQGIGERDYSGMGRGMRTDRQEQHDRMFDQADRRSSEHDEDFDNFRTDQMNKLEGDYREWRNERRKKFAEEFEKWRSERNSKQAAQVGTEGTQGSKKNP